MIYELWSQLITEQSSHIICFIMDPNKTAKQANTSLASVVAAQGVRLEKLTTGVDSAFNIVQSEINELRQSSAGTVAAISKLSDQLIALTSAITTQAAHNVAPPAPGEVNPPIGIDPALAPLSDDPSREPNIPSPKTYEGDLARCCGFVTQCELVFRHNPSRFYSDDAKIAFIVSLLSGRALDWAVASFNHDALFASEYSRFISEFRLVFDHPPDGSDSATRLHSLNQGTRSVAEYAVEFRILAARSFWGDAALRSAFRRGLNEPIKDLILRDQPSSLSELIALALKVDDRLRERRLERSTRITSPAPRSNRPFTPRELPVIANSHVTSNPLVTVTNETEPMQLGRSRLTPTMREHRMQNRLCLYCGKSGHFIQACDVRPKDQTH